MNQLQDALYGLLKKYDLKPDFSLNILPGWSFFNQQMGGKDIPVFPWRTNRKFVELQKIISGNVVEHACMLRFCCLTDEHTGLPALLYREFDLCEYIGQSRIQSLHATFTGGRGGNVIVKLENGIIGSVEIGNLLPTGAEMIDRHEIIARRGVASDLVVDTQIPQKSVYMYTDKGEIGYKDTDNELFGLKEIEIEWVRSAFDFLKNSHGLSDYLNRHKHLSSLIHAALESDRECRKIEVN